MRDMAGTPADPKPKARMRPCPVCGKLAMAAHHPFCSPRCADVDLNRWLSGGYAIPGKADTDEEDSSPVEREPRE